MKIFKFILFFILLSCSTNIMISNDAENAPIKQKQFCDLKIILI